MLGSVPVSPEGPPGSVSAGLIRQRVQRLFQTVMKTVLLLPAAVRVTLRPVEHSVSPCCSISQLTDSFNMMESEGILELCAYFSSGFQNEREVHFLSLLSSTLIVNWISLHFGQNKAVDDVVLGFVPVSDCSPSGIGLI